VCDVVLCCSTTTHRLIFRCPLSVVLRNDVFHIIKGKSKSGYERCQGDIIFFSFYLWRIHVAATMPALLSALSPASLIDVLFDSSAAAPSPIARYGAKNTSNTSSRTYYLEQRHFIVDAAVGRVVDLR
jgi:hypothetical protein